MIVAKVAGYIVYPSDNPEVCRLCNCASTQEYYVEYMQKRLRFCQTCMIHAGCSCRLGQSFEITAAMIREFQKC